MSGLLDIFKKKSGKNMGVSVPAGIDVSATPSHQENVALAYVAGEYIQPASWISPSYNEHDVGLPVQSAGGKGGGKGGGGASSQQQWKRYATVVCVWHVGVADRLTGVILDEALVWSGNIVRMPGTHYVDVAIEGRGIYRHYWGTQTTTDPLLLATGNNYGDEHPSYEGCCYGIFIDFLYGINVEQAPAPRIRGERTPVQPFLTGIEAQNDDGQANLICVAAELLLDTRFGISFPESLCETNVWRAAIEEAYARRNNCFCSPVIGDHQELRSFLADLFTIGDLYLRPDPVTGLLAIGFWTKPEDIDPESLVTIVQGDLMEPHGLQPGSWDDVKNTWNVSFRNRDYVMKEDQVSDFDQRVLDIHQGETRPEEIQASPIVRKWQAQWLAAERKQREGLPPLEGTIKVNAEQVETVNSGDHIRTDIDLRPGGLSKQQVFRVLRVKRSWDDIAELTLKAERTLAPIIYNAPIVERQPDPEKDEIPEVGVSRFFELPWLNYQVGILAARVDGLQTGFSIHYDRNQVGTYQSIASSNGTGFALKAKLTEALPSDLDPAPVKIELIGSLERQLIASDPGDVGARDDQILLILVKTQAGQIAADADGLAFIEVLSCQNFVVTAPNQVTVTALRGRQKSLARPFAVNTEAWIIRRADLPIVDHADFKDLGDTSATAYFKLQAVKLRDFRPLEDCTARPFTFALARPVSSDRIRYLERRYKRSVTNPGAPEVADPDDWFISMADATGIGALWVTEAYKYQDDNTLVGSWSVPVQIIEDPHIFDSFEEQLAVLQQDTSQLVLDTEQLADDIAAEASARGTSISQEQTARQNADSAETTARTLAISTLQGQVDGKATIAALNSEASTRATADSAETTARETAISQVQDAVSGKASIAALDSESSTRATADSAETTARQTAISLLQDDLNGKATTAALTSEASTRATDDAAETSARQTAVSQLQSDLNGKASTAALSSESSTRATADSAETTARETAISSVENAISGKASLAALQEEVTTRATETSALASDVETLGAQVGDVSSAISIQAATLATLAGNAEARYGINIETNAGGHKVVAGVEFVSKAGSTPTSEMRLKAGMNLLSEDYVPGVSGWIKKGNGDGESNSEVFRGIIRASKMVTDCVAVHKDYLDLDLRRTSSWSNHNGPVKLFGAGCKAFDASTADANRTYWYGEWDARRNTYNTMYSDYDSDGYWTGENNDQWVSGIDSTEEAALVAQMALVDAALASYNYWQAVYEGTQADIDQVVGCSATPTTFKVFATVGFSGSFGDIHLKYRVNGGGWTEFGVYKTEGGSNPQPVMFWPLKLILGVTDTIEFDMNWSAGGYGGRDIVVEWSNN